jgi:hypothetical protein
MTLALVLSVLAANASTVTVEVPSELSCPRGSQLTALLTEAGLKVVPAYGGLEVKLAQVGTDLTITARRAIDGKTYRRSMKTSQGDCDTVEHLVAVMVVAWANPELPFLTPKRPFRPPHPPLSSDGGPEAPTP